jgi:hypothetical protein
MQRKKKVSVSPGVSARRNESIHRSIGDERSRHFLLWNRNGRVHRLDHPLVGMMTKAKVSRRLLPDRGLQQEHMLLPSKARDA